MIYTDGVTDACNPSSQEFRETRLQRTVQRQHGQQASVVIDAIWTAVSRFTQDAPPVDDMTCAVVTRPPRRP
ncbi:MAG: SpoIIE family protein phosphatase [Acidobacteria bacterium]|nr:SpoIIE family protein phosphatase [Acidobacteriota bacterium]